MSRLDPFPGTDAEYRAFIQRLPSAISGRFSEFVDGEGRCEAAHVRRSKDSGTAFKAPFATIPLTNDEHNHQHQHAESGCLERHLGGTWSRVGAARLPQ